MFVAYFAHENAAGLLDYFRVNYPRRIPEIVHVDLTASDSIYRFAVAAGTKGKSFTRNTDPHRHSLTASGQWAGCPTRVRHSSLRAGGVKAFREGPSCI